MFQPVRNGDRSGRASRLCGFALILAGSGCSVAFDLDREQCETTADCVAAGQDLTVRLCAALDAGCANPIAGTPQPDDDGRVLIDVAPSFKGFLEATGPDLVPSLYFLQSPVVLPMNENVIRVVTPGEYNPLAIASGFMVDDTRGTAVILTDNCLDERAAGVTISTLDVAVDDIAAGTTPLDKPLVMSVGRRNISVTKPGYAPLTRYVDMAGGENKKLRFDLIARGPGDEVPSPPHPDRSRPSCRRTRASPPHPSCSSAPPSPSAPPPASSAA